MVSDKANKTVIVAVERRVMHPVYKKFISARRSTPRMTRPMPARSGDMVRIHECRPISKTKRWEVVSEDTAQAPAAAAS